MRARKYDHHGRHESSGGPPPLLTGEEVCRRLNCSKSHLRTLRIAGALPSIQLGRLRRYNAEDVEALVARGTGMKE